MDMSVALRLVRQANRDVLSDQELEVFDEMAEVLEGVDPAEVRQRVGELRIGELRSRYEAIIELGRQRRAATGTTDHGQEQSAAHQQHRSQGTGRT